MSHKNTTLLKKSLDAVCYNFIHKMDARNEFSAFVISKENTVVLRMTPTHYVCYMQREYIQTH